VTKKFTIGGDGLHMGFDIEKSDKEENPNVSQVHVFNLGDQNREFLSINSIGNSKATIYAGYKDSMELLYLGDIAEIKDRMEGGDMLTTFTLCSGFNEKQKGEQSNSFGKGATLKEVVDSSIKSIKKNPEQYPLGLSTIVSNPENFVPVGIQVIGTVKDKVFKRGVVQSSNNLEFATNELKQAGHKVKLEDNTLKVADENGNLEGAPIYVINSETGMIGVPEQLTRSEELQQSGGSFVQVISDKISSLFSRDDKDSEEVAQPTKAEIGYKITTLLMPKIGAFDKIRLSSKRLKIENLELTVATVRHYGSNFDNDYYTEIEAFVR
jgi:hypothetical protein